VCGEGAISGQTFQTGVFFCKCGCVGNEPSQAKHARQGSFTECVAVWGRCHLRPNMPDRGLFCVVPSQAKHARQGSFFVSVAVWGMNHLRPNIPIPTPILTMCQGKRRKHCHQKSPMNRWSVLITSENVPSRVLYVNSDIEQNFVCPRCFCKIDNTQLKITHINATNLFQERSTQLSSIESIQTVWQV
jgi:hypothetical protein